MQWPPASPSSASSSSSQAHRARSHAHHDDDSDLVNDTDITSGVIRDDADDEVVLLREAEPSWHGATRATHTAGAPSQVAGTGDLRSLSSSTSLASSLADAANEPASHSSTSCSTASSSPSPSPSPSVLSLVMGSHVSLASLAAATEAAAAALEDRQTQLLELQRRLVAQQQAMQAHTQQQREYLQHLTAAAARAAAAATTAALGEPNPAAAQATGGHDPSATAEFRALLYSIYVQQYLELIDAGEREAAFTFLARHLKPLEHMRNSETEFADLCYLLSCRAVRDAPSWHAWPGPMRAREALVERFRALFFREPRTIAPASGRDVPPGRLVSLLQQAAAYQMEFSRYLPPTVGLGGDLGAASSMSSAATPSAAAGALPSTSSSSSAAGTSYLGTLFDGGARAAPRRSRQLISSLLDDYRCFVVPNTLRASGVRHASNAKCLAFGGDDGLILLSGGSDCVVRVWLSDTFEDEPRGRALSSSASALTMLKAADANGGGDHVSTDGHAPAARRTSSSRRSQARPQSRHDAVGAADAPRESRELRSVAVLRGHTARVWDVACDASGSIAASASADGTVRVWSLASCREAIALRPVGSVGAPVSSVAGAASAAAAAAGAATAGAAAAAATTGAATLHHPEAFAASAAAVASSHGIAPSASTSSLSVSSSPPPLPSPGSVMAHGMHDDPRLRAPQLPVASFRVPLAPRAEFVPPTSLPYLRASSASPLVHASAPPLVLSGHSHDVYSVAIHPGGAHVVSGGYDGVVRLYDVHTGALARTFVGHAAPVTGVCLNARGNMLVTGSKDGSIRFWDLVSSACLRTLDARLGEISSVALDAAGTRLLSGSKDSSNRLWDLRTAKALQRFRGHLNASRNFVRCRFGPEENLVVGGSECGRVHVWDVESGKLLRRLGGAAAATAGSVYDVRWHANSSLLASCGEDGIVRTWVEE